jgi:hypothetical protein
MQLVFRLGILGNENFGVLWNQFYCPLVQEEEEEERRHMGCCSVMLLLKLMLGTQQQQQVLTRRSVVTRLVCHILGVGG